MHAPRELDQIHSAETLPEIGFPGEFCAVLQGELGGICCQGELGENYFHKEPSETYVHGKNGKTDFHEDFDEIYRSTAELCELYFEEEFC